MTFRILYIFLTTLCFATAAARAADDKTYSRENPLIYEDPELLWPFSFLNEQGEPDGFNIDLTKMLMDELDIPYVIRLKPQQEVMQDQRDGKADLTLGSTATFHRMPGHYGRHTITLLTQSIAMPKGQKASVKTFRDLSTARRPIIVKDSSLCHHLMLDYGWAANARPNSDMSQAIRKVSEEEEGQIVWNTLSLQWLIRHLQLDNMELEAIDMPHTEFRYMSHDQHLLDLIDKKYAELCATDRLSALEEKWFHPEQKDQDATLQAWLQAAAALLLLAGAIVLLVRLARRCRHVAAADKKLSDTLAQMSEDASLRVWTYDTRKATFTWLDKEGHPLNSRRQEDFAKRYNKKDFALLKENLDRLASRHKDGKGQEETEATLELKAKDPEYGDGQLHDFALTLSVINRDKDGKPTVILATKKDITRELALKQQNYMRSLRFWSVFYNSESGIVYFDKDGCMKDANSRACELFDCDADTLVSQHVHIGRFLSATLPDLDKADGLRGITNIHGHAIHYQLKTAFNDERELLGIFVFCV